MLKFLSAAAALHSDLLSNARLATTNHQNLPDWRQPQRPAAAPACCCCRAAPRPVNGAKTIEQAAAGLLAAGVALSLTMGAPAPAMARTTVTFEQKRQEREAAVQAQLSKLEYAFEQQQTAARAEIVGK
jgi:hypothetical protein